MRHHTAIYAKMKCSRHAVKKGNSYTSLCPHAQLQHLGFHGHPTNWPRIPQLIITPRNLGLEFTAKVTQLAFVPQTGLELAIS